MRGYNIDDFVGKKFNHLTLIKNINKIDKNNSKLALFRCDLCNKEKELVFTQVLNNSVKTCGCKRGYLSTKSREKQQTTALKNYSNKTMKNNKTGKTGIIAVNGKYRARIQVNKKMVNLGYFDTLDDAIKARKEAEERYFKPILDKYKEID